MRYSIVIWFDISMQEKCAFGLGCVCVYMCLCLCLKGDIY